jgi:2-octaprenyl-6-methoxyphenol hydroxylase
MDKDLKDQLDSDVFISGGGPVGLMLALGLAQQKYRVVLAEKIGMDYGAAAETLSQSSFDGRVLALSQGSQQVLQSLGVWPKLEPYVCAILHVHVSQKGYMGITRLHASEVGAPALGFSIQSSDLGRVLWEAATQQENITLLCPGELLRFEDRGTHVCAWVRSRSSMPDSGVWEESRIQAKLIVGADGTSSLVRQQLKLPIVEKSYHAFGVIAKIETEQAAHGWSYERFTEEGPVALLPMQGRSHKAVLVCPEGQLDEVMALDDEGFMALFAEKMGERLGAYTSVSERVAYPLKESYVPTINGGRAILMGNAAHTQHPVAAQGLNLGIRDIAAFLSRLTPGQDPGEAQWLSGYAQSRKTDHENVMGMTDGLIQVFQHRSPLVGHLRGLGLMTLQALPSLKKRFARFAMRGGAQ